MMLHKNIVDQNVLSALQPEAVEASDAEFLVRYKESVEEVIRNARTERSRKERSGWRIRDDLGPIVFDGDPKTARVVFLKANPSYGDGATRKTHFQPHPDWPLSVAGTHVVEATRAYYHDKVFASLRRSGVSLHQISTRMIKVELCPWASKKWPTGQEHLLDQLELFPSRAQTYALVHQLVDQGALVLIARAEECWFSGVPALKALLGTRVFVSRAKIAPAISENMYPGSWSLLLQALRS